MKEFLKLSSPYSGIRYPRNEEHPDWSEFEKEMQYEIRLNKVKAKGSFKRSLDVIMGVSRPLN